MLIAINLLLLCIACGPLLVLGMQSFETDSEAPRRRSLRTHVTADGRQQTEELEQPPVAVEAAAATQDRPRFGTAAISAQARAIAEEARAAVAAADREQAARERRTAQLKNASGAAGATGLGATAPEPPLEPFESVRWQPVPANGTAPRNTSKFKRSAALWGPSWSTSGDQAELSGAVSGLD